MKRIAIQGYRGAFHHEAAEYYFGSNIELEECLSFEMVIKSVTSKVADYGIMAVENSLIGCILPNFFLLRESGLNIIGEVYLRIKQNLMALPNQTINDLSLVKSQSMAIEQCVSFLSSHPHLQVIESPDTAYSAKMIADEKLRGVGAIGSHYAASAYGLEIIVPSIETNKENFTRFMILSRQTLSIPDDEPVKATIAFTANHVPGSLAKILTSLADEGVNLSMLQSLPMKESAWEYIFHADLCYPAMKQAKKSLRRLSEELTGLWIMGIYPAKNIKENNKSQIAKMFSL